MKRLVLLLILMIMALSIVSCDKREGDDGLPTFDEVLEDPDEDFYLILDYSKNGYSDDSDALCTLITKRRLEELWINSELVTPYHMSYDNDTDRYCYEMIPLNLDGVLPSGYNEEIAYQLKLQGKTVTGSLLMPAEYFVDVPWFDPAQNFSLVWTLAEDPKAQDVALSIRDTDSNVYEYYYNMKPTARTYTFNKKLWSDYQPAQCLYRLYLEAHNYHKKSGGIIWFISSYYTDQLEYGKKSLHNRRVEKILRGEEALPR